ncbi:MAG TPA: DUF6351 family protein [Myxococcales bacterium]|nr:DUF6351 family protein [Myxococcales bacterium]
MLCLRSRHEDRLLSASLAAGLLLLGTAAVADRRSADDLSIATVSTRADLVSGGDVLVRIDVPRSVALSDLEVRVNGAIVTGAFLPDSTGDALVGLVSGLNDGDNVLTAATIRSRPSRHARLAIRNSPSSGPVFGGPHQSPWICETAASGLGPPPASGPCVVQTIQEWFYRATDNTFKPLPSPSTPLPSDLAQTTTIDGRTVNYVVRVESGTINESIYRIAIIDDPTDPIRNPWSAGGKKPGAGWNGKLSFPFGGGCGPAFRSGRNLVSSALANDPLSLGFAVAFGTRNTLGNGCNFVVSAETMMMIKEHFTEQYGVPRFTIGSGGSGGSMQQHFIAQNYPGLLDAITPGISYSDLVSILPDVTDCGLLNNYFDNIANPADWPPARRSKVDGYPAATTVGGVAGTTCKPSWNAFAHIWVSPFNGFDAVVPLAARYDPTSNPGGARGSFTDGMINVFGFDSHTGFARTVFDNVGVQYGLHALNRGQITPDEFLDLNEKIGGIDVDGNSVPDRTAANLRGLEIAYGNGVLTSGQNLTLPIIDTRNYTDEVIDIHTRIRTFAKLERLKKANGTTANEVNWLTPRLGATGVNIAQLALRAHNEWLENISADATRDSYAAKVIRNKPAWVKDACWETNGTRHDETFTRTGPSVCNSLFPIYSTVRIEAGGTLAGDVLKCRLKRIDSGDYAVSFSAAQKARLQAIFPSGVCDWSKRGVKQRPVKAFWLDYSRSQGGDGDDDGEGDRED